MPKDSNIQIFGRKYTLKSLQAVYQAVLDEFFSGARGITSCALSEESIAFKVRYVFELLRVLSLSPISRDTYIVDFGCERGDMLALLQRIGFTRLCGINLTQYDPRWLVDERYFNILFGDKPGKIQYLTWDMDNSRLPLRNDEVSIAILSDVLEHLSNPGWVLSEINRVLVEGGLAVIGTPNIASIRNRLYLLFGRSLHPDLETWLSTRFRLDGRYIGHTREYTLDELKRLMQIYGFKPLRCCFVPTLTISKDMKVGNIRVSPFMFKLYDFFEKIWPGGRHRIIIVSQKTNDDIEPLWVPVPQDALLSRKLLRTRANET